LELFGKRLNKLARRRRNLFQDSIQGAFLFRLSSQQRKFGALGLNG
jgi:hypothetical protein